jgi:hypothetical protein
MCTRLNPQFSSDAYTFYTDVAQGYDLFISSEYSSGSFSVLGDASFPAIIVANETIKGQIENSWFWHNQGGVSSGGLNWIYGYQNPTTGETFYGGVGPNYSILVNPSGIGNWAEGCVESPLEAYWIAYKFTGAYSLDAVYSQVSTFYQTYFGITLSPDQIRTILGE